MDERSVWMVRGMGTIGDFNNKRNGRIRMASL